MVGLVGSFGGRILFGSGRRVSQGIGFAMKRASRVKPRNTRYSASQWRSNDQVGHVSVLNLDTQVYTSLHGGIIKTPRVGRRNDIPGLEGRNVPIYQQNLNYLTQLEDEQLFGPPVKRFLFEIPNGRPKKNAVVKNYYQLADSEKGAGDHHNCVDAVKNEIMEETWCSNTRLKISKMPFTTEDFFVEMQRQFPPKEWY